MVVHSILLWKRKKKVNFFKNLQQCAGIGLSKNICVDKAINKIVSKTISYQKKVNSINFKREMKESKDSSCKVSRRFKKIRARINGRYFKRQTKLIMKYFKLKEKCYKRDVCENSNPDIRTGDTKKLKITIQEVKSKLKKYKKEFLTLKKFSFDDGLYFEQYYKLCEILDYIKEITDEYYLNSYFSARLKEINEANKQINGKLLKEHIEEKDKSRKEYMSRVDKRIVMYVDNINILNTISKIK